MLRCPDSAWYDLTAPIRSLLGRSNLLLNPVAINWLHKSYYPLCRCWSPSWKFSCFFRMDATTLSKTDLRSWSVVRSWRLAILSKTLQVITGSVYQGIFIIPFRHVAWWLWLRLSTRCTTFKNSYNNAIIWDVQCSAVLLDRRRVGILNCIQWLVTGFWRGGMEAATCPQIEKVRESQPFFCHAVTCSGVILSRNPTPEEGWTESLLNHLNHGASYILTISAEHLHKKIDCLALHCYITELIMYVGKWMNGITRSA